MITPSEVASPQLDGRPTTTKLRATFDVRIDEDLAFHPADGTDRPAGDRRRDPGHGAP